MCLPTNIFNKTFQADKQKYTVSLSDKRRVYSKTKSVPVQIFIGQESKNFVKGLG